MLPPRVPWLRIWGEAAASAPVERMLNFWRTSGWRTTSVSVVVAPISRPPFQGRMPLSSFTWLRSTTAAGRLMRSFSQSKVSRPPPMTQASLPYFESIATASSVVAGWKSSNAGMMSRMIAISVLLRSDVGRQRLARRLAGFERRQNNVRGHGRAADDFVAERVRKSIDDRHAAGAHGRLADAARADRGFGIGNVERRPLHVDGRIENRRRLVVVEAFCQRQAVVLVIDPFLPDGVADAEH